MYNAAASAGDRDRPSIPRMRMCTHDFVHNKRKTPAASWRSVSQELGKGSFLEKLLEMTISKAFSKYPLRYMYIQGGAKKKELS